MEKNFIQGNGQQGLFEQFAAQLENYTKTQQVPMLGNQDVRYYLELQQKRLHHKNLRLEYKIVPRGLESDKTLTGAIWSDALHQNELNRRTCALTQTFFRNNAPVYKKEENKTFYQTITYLKNNIHMADIANEPYVCPNCGAISTVGELQVGCRYCGTHFIMQELFPKVTSFLFMEDLSEGEGELKQKIFKYSIPWLVVETVICLVTNLMDSKLPFMLSLLLSIPQIIFASIVMGFLTWVVVKFYKLITGATKEISFLKAASGSSTKFESQMKQFSPEFSYDYFSNKVASLLKIIAFSENATELVNYCGPSIANLFSDIVEMSFLGIALNQFVVKDGIIFVSVIAYIDDLYERNGHFSKKSDKFRMELCRRIDQSLEYNFSIKKVRCKNCGASFDATKSKFCPYCRTQYDAAYDDWVVTAVARI